MERTQRWVLAFDASCGTCRYLADVVSRECGDRLEIRPLDDELVSGWRRQALGAGATSAPTLIRVHGEQVRAWTGPMMAVRLVRRLGPRATARLLRVMGELRSRSEAPTIAGKGFGRKAFLKYGAGAAAAAGIVLLGKTPAFADPAERLHNAREWANANRGTLPQDYDGLARYQLTYRQAIFQVLPASERRQLWLEHLARHRATRPILTPAQGAALQRAEALLADGRVFTPAGRDALQGSLDELRVSAVAAFGAEDARDIFTTLGPPSPTAHQVAAGNGVQACPTCECSTASNWCSGGTSNCCSGSCLDSFFKNCECTWDGGCGTFWSYDCNGHCGTPGCPSWGRCR